jgi:hypothetical protein
MDPVFFLVLAQKLSTRVNNGIPGVPAAVLSKDLTASLKFAKDSST